MTHKPTTPNEFDSSGLQAAVPPVNASGAASKAERRRNRSKTSDGGDADERLVSETRQQIRELVEEIATLAKSDCSVEEFHQGLLTRITTALAAIGGAIWMRENPTGPLKPGYQINMSESFAGSTPTAMNRHAKLLQQLADSGEPTLVSPNSGDDSSAAANPTEHLLVVGPISVDRNTIGLIEVLQRPGAGPATQRGYLRFVVQMCEIASDYHRNEQLRSFAAQQTMWQQLEHFIDSVHRGLDPDQTAYTIVNEARRLIDCDRVSVLLGKGRRCRVKAVSGLDSIERRAEQVRKLNSLAVTVVKAGQPLWYKGEDADLPPQIETRLHDYVDSSHCKMLAIIPLVQTETPVGQQEPKITKRSSKPIGALVVEQLKDSDVHPAFERRTEVVVQHSQTALTNALAHNRIFLMPLWKTLGNMMPDFSSGGMWKLLVLPAAAGIAAFLTLFPYHFSLGAGGKLQPQIQHEVFAQVDGVLEQIPIADSEVPFVRQGDVLAVMTNSDLNLAIQNLEGQIAETRAQIASDLRLQSRGGLDEVESVMLDGRLNSAVQSRKSLEKELDIKRREAEQLNVRSPADGQVVNWQLRQNLLRRPVLRGQNLMTIVDPNTDFEIELELPERRLAHLLDAEKESDEPLEVTFGLISHPGSEYQGVVKSIDRRLDVHSDAGNTAKIRVAFENQQIGRELLRSGTRVTAKVHCGTRSIGYVVFHELIETVQSSVLFWL
jgi:multidrug resistance efflux pump